MCKQSGESINHLLLYCQVARVLWSVVLTLFDVTWVMSEGLVDLLVCWRSQCGNISAKEVWRIAPLCLMWIIWRERNARCFEDQDRSMEELKKLLIQTLFHWTEDCNVPKISTMSQFLSLCSSFCL
jgi:hypothetical protein